MSIFCETYSVVELDRAQRRRKSYMPAHLLPHWTVGRHILLCESCLFHRATFFVGRLDKYSVYGLSKHWGLFKPRYARVIAEYIHTHYERFDTLEQAMLYFSAVVV